MVLVVGDVHGEWEKLNVLLNRKNPDVILQCGDFGYFPNMEGQRTKYYFDSQGEKHETGKKWSLYGVKNKGTKIYWCDGNHENHEALKELENNETAKDIFYMKRGSVLNLPDGRTVLFMGGAQSSDKNMRLRGYDWFPEEVLTMNDLYSIPNDIKKVDIVISHTCPTEILHKLHKRYDHIDSSCQILSFILSEYKPEHWYFGHWHQDFDYVYGSTTFHAMNMVGVGRWWMKLQ